MAQRRHHYERAFEAYLRHRRIPYVAVDEAKRALLPEHAQSARLRVPAAVGADDDPFAPSSAQPAGPRMLKSFDFVIYGEKQNLLLDVKGRRIARKVLAQRTPAGALLAPPPRTRLESWVTLDDIDSLSQWASIFGPGFAPAFVFVYWCEEQPPDALFQEVFDFQGRWYALRGVTLDRYRPVMKTRSARWRTVDLPAAAFERISQPVGPDWLGSVA